MGTVNHSNFSNSKLIDIVGVWGGWGPTITVAWGLIRPKSGPDCAYTSIVAYWNSALQFHTILKYEH